MRIIEHYDIVPPITHLQHWNLAQKNVRIRRSMSKTRLHLLYARSILSHATHQAPL